MLSYFMVVRDAAQLLAPAIANARRFADEVLVVVDNASTDASLAVARQLADRTEHWPVGGSYESVLNQAAAACRGDWILYGHDDELWTPAFRAALPGLLAVSTAPEYVFSRRHIVRQTATAACQWITDAPLWPDWQSRLRTRESWRERPWPRQVHSTPAAGAGWQYVNVPIWHLKFAVKSFALRVARLAMWAGMWAEANSAHYRSFSLPEELQLHTAPLDEREPEEFAAMLAAGQHEPDESEIA